MIPIRFCIIVTFLVHFSINLTSSKEPEPDFLVNEEELQNLVDNLRSRRHTEALDIYQQPYIPALHKRKRGFLSNLKEKIISFITGKNKRYQRPSIPDEVIEDESTNNLEASQETDSKIQETTSFTTMKTERNLSNADLVIHLQKMLKNYEKTLKKFKQSKPHHKKYKKHNVTMNSHEKHESVDRKKRYYEKKLKKKTKSRRFHSINLDKEITTESPSTYLSIGSHAEDHHPKNYNYLEETKKRDKILNSILRLGSHKKHYESTKPIDKINSNEKINNIIKQSKLKDFKSSVYISSNEKTNNKKKESKRKNTKFSRYISSKVKLKNHIKEFLRKDSKTSNYISSNEKTKCSIKGSKRKDLKSSGYINSNEIINNEIQEFEHKGSKTSHYLSSNEKTNNQIKGSKPKNLKSSGYINSNEKTQLLVKESKHKGDSFSHEHLENGI